MDVITGGGKTVTVNVGLAQYESIRGTVYNDTNLNGSLDSGETALSSWQLYLDSNGNAIMDSGEAQTTSASNGSFAFPPLKPGTYVVREVVKSGWKQSPAGQKYQLTITSGTTPPAISFGNVQNVVTGGISGTIFNDANGNGSHDSGEAAMPNVAAYLDTNNNGKLDSGERSVVTSSLGALSFTNLSPGTYHVRETIPAGYRLTTTSPVNVIVVAGKSAAVSFGNQRLATISGTIYNDINGSAALDAGDPHLANVKLFIDLNKNGKLDAGEASTISAAGGTYSFTNLVPGSYRVMEIAPSGFVTGEPVLGWRDVTVTAGQTLTANFGNLKPAAPVSFSGTVFKDLNLDAIKQSAEPGLAGWRFYVDLNNNSAFDVGEPSALSNSAGFFTIGNIKTGRYIVRAVVPAGWRLSNVATWSATSFGKNVTGLNFAASQTARIAGTVFLDANKNGALDTAESTLSGWTVYLDTNNNGKLDAGEKSVVTAANGQFAFAVAAGTYVVRVVQQSGYALTTAGSYKLTLSSGQTLANENFGEQKTA